MHGKIRPIVVGVDHEGSAVALCWAAREAALCGRPLRLVYAKTDPYATIMASYVGAVVLEPGDPAPATALEVLTRAVGAVRLWQPDVPVTAYAELGDPAHVVIEQARTAAMVVLGQHDSGRLAQLLAGSITGTVAGHATCPVVTVTAQPTWPDAPIVVAADGTTAGSQAIRFGFELAARHGVPLLVQQVPRRRWRRAREDDPTAEISAQVAACAALRDADASPVEVAIRRAPGDPVSALLDAAADAQLLVVGARARGALLRSAPCPLAVIRPGCLAI